MARWKARVEFLLSVIELLFLFLAVEALQGKMCQNSLTLGGGRSLGAKISGGRGRPPCQYVDTTRKTIDCSTTLALTVFTSIPSGILTMQPFGRYGYGPKIGVCASLGEGELGPHLTQCDQGRGLRARIRTITFIMYVCMTSFILIRPTVWPQYTNVTDRQDRTGQRSDSIGRTVLQTVSRKLHFGRPGGG